MKKNKKLKNMKLLIASLLCTLTFTLINVNVSATKKTSTPENPPQSSSLNEKDNNPIDYDEKIKQLEEELDYVLNSEEDIDINKIDDPEFLQQQKEIEELKKQIENSKAENYHIGVEKTFKIFDDIILEKDFNNYELLIDKLMSNIKEQLTQNTQNQFDEILNEIKKVTKQNEKQIENNKSKADLKDEIENQVIEIKDMIKKDDQNLQNKFNEIGGKLKEIKEQLGIQDSKIEDNPEDEIENNIDFIEQNNNNLNIINNINQENTENMSFSSKELNDKFPKEFISALDILQNSNTKSIDSPKQTFDLLKKLKEENNNKENLKDELENKIIEIEDNPEDEYSNQKEQNEIIEKKITNKKKKKKT